MLTSERVRSSGIRESQKAVEVMPIRTRTFTLRSGHVRCEVHVRFGSKADMCTAPAHVRFTPNSDRESRLPEKVMSALTPKADMCSAVVHVCFGQKRTSAVNLSLLALDHALVRLT